MVTRTKTPPLSALWLDESAWTLALEAAGGSPPDITAPAWATLIEEGIAAGIGRLAPAWFEALHAHLQAPITLSVTAQHDGFAHRGEIKAAGGSTSSFVRRYKTERADDGRVQAVSVDPQAEFCHTEPGQAWALVRHLLPPVEALRAEPRQTPGNRRIVRPIESDPDLLKELDTDTSVLITASTTLPLNPEPPTRVHWSRYFAVTGPSLWEIGRQDGQAVATKVQAGEVGFAVWWLVEDCRQALARYGRQGEQ